MATHRPLTGANEFANIKFMSEITAENIQLAILDGELDNDLAVLIDAARERQVAGLRIGDTIRFSDYVRPKYLVGLTATVAKVNPRSIVVDCPSDPTYFRYAGAKNVRCPLSLIEGKV